ncbi:MAG: hypothetical protein IJS96_03340 [Schwartzia sp.]|nr:hypothetical protein [Schwartzia sp. (in: firmicutes)]
MAPSSPSPGFDCPRLIMPETMAERLAVINPRYPAEGYRHNCPKCVAAYEMRCRGYDVEARPASLDEPVIQRWPEIFTGAVFDFLPGSGKSTIRERLLAYGGSARIIVYIEWKPSLRRGPHVFIAENRAGRIRFLDPQTGGNNVEYYFRAVVPGKTAVARIDCLAPRGDYIRQCCRARKGDIP